MLVVWLPISNDWYVMIVSSVVAKSGVYLGSTIGRCSATVGGLVLAAISTGDADAGAAEAAVSRITSSSDTGLVSDILEQPTTVNVVTRQAVANFHFRIFPPIAKRLSSSVLDRLLSAKL